MSDYKFYYFGFYVRGEPIRMLLSHAGVDYEDVVIGFDKWPEYKPTMPNKQVPCLELKDGTRMGESYAIGRYLGSIHGYYPTDARQALEVDYLLEGYEALLSVIYKPFFAKPEEKDALIADIFAKSLPKLLDVVEPICAKGEFLVGSKLTIADFWIGGLYTNFINNKNIPYAQDKWGTCLDNYPNFKAYGERFSEAVKGRLDSRPQCPV